MLLLFASLLVARNIIGVQTEECPMQGVKPARDSGSHNFVIDSLNGNNFPFAIGQCTATSINPDKWYKYSCESVLGAWVVTKKEYSDAQCSGSGTFVLNFETQFDEWQQYYECEGSDTYLQLDFGVGGCQSTATVYAGLASCIHDDTNSGDFEFFCNDTTALVHYFGSFGNETLMSTTNNPMASTTALPLSSTNIMLSSTQMGFTSTSEMDMNLTTTDLDLPDLNMSTTDFDLPDLNMSTTLPELNMTTNFPIFSSLISTKIPLSTLFPTRFVTTLMSLMPTYSTSTNNMCDDSQYCDVWILSKDTCKLAKASALKDYNIYVQMKQCGATQEQQQTTGSNIQTHKAGSIHSPLAISGILTLLFAIYWL